jgi:outer membrane biosynthesis protein TonB
MKRLFLIVVTMITLMAFQACQSCKKDGPYNSKPVVTQTEPKKTEVVPPKITQPEVAPPKTDVTPPKVVTPKIKRPKVVTPRIEFPKTEPKVVTPKVEPPTEPKVAVVPKTEPPKKCVTQPRVSIVDYWLVPHPSGTVRDLFAITFVVKNPTSKDVKVKVVCHYVNGSLFGESMPQTVDANSDAKLMVRGFKRCPSADSCHESFDCRIELVS